MKTLFDTGFMLVLFFLFKMDRTEEIKKYIDILLASGNVTVILS